MLALIPSMQMQPGSARDDLKSTEIQTNLGDASSPKVNLDLISTFEGGRLYRAGKFNVLVLNGNYREMGRQYGGLLGPQIEATYQESLNVSSNTTAYLEKEMGMKDPGVSLQNFSNSRFQTYPKRFQEMILGMSETSGTSVEKICTINEFFDYYLWRIANPAVSSSAKFNPDPELQGHCSAITAWGNYTGGEPLVMGRDFDFPPVYKDLDKYIEVIVFNPSDGSNSAAVIAYAGMVGAIQSFNKAGLVLEDNDGSTSGDINRPLDRGSFLIMDLQYMFDCSTLAGLDAAMKSSRTFYPLVYNIADPKQAYCYETTTFDVKRRGGIDGLLVGVNHFLIPDWSKEGIFINNSMDSLSRHQNLTALGNKYKGRINSTVMRAIMDTPIEKGGATLNDTIYQFVAEPELREIWLKASGFENWTEVDLGTLFN